MKNGRKPLDPVNGSVESQVLRDALRRVGAFRAHDIAATIGCAHRGVNLALMYLAQRGQITRVSRGLYTRPSSVGRARFKAAVRPQADRRTEREKAWAEFRGSLDIQAPDLHVNTLLREGA